MTVATLLDLYYQLCILVSLSPPSTSSTMADQNITVTYQDRVAIVTLDRPDKLNALNADLYYLLGERLREIDERDDIFITVLTGTGRFFSA